MSLADLAKNFRENKLAYFYVLPSFLVLGFVVLYPFIYNLVISFSNMSLTNFLDWKFVGFEQYVKVFAEPQFYILFLKTITWTVVNLFFHVTIGVSLALLLHRPLPGRAIFRTLLILPWAVPQYITALTWRGMFNYEFGSINLIMQQILNLAPVQWLSDPFWAYTAATITNIWLGFPFMMIIALGGLQSIPKELYEAADVDGASSWRQFWTITAPLLKPVMVPAITLGVIWTFNNFNVIWLVSDGGKPADSTHILVSYVYRQVFNYYRYGFAAALSLVIFGILLVFGIRFIKQTKATEAVY
ncbi:sugar ABC transporter permease [bacterium]|nr:MAG: sugar ABC transporter permease [candidate division KSB1 bacterium]MBC6948939.1 sugar ABC transporter permease [candidate division KSB1 bacterium]MCE7945370.1 sugar ABC transporter permease [Chlorobi bacterium CHB1]MCL4708488.1 sugar ABC transporter permease [bacterium]MDL1876054.1 sugar ABC transporter permease [Cytophagia bacterium CHB2]